MYPLGASDTAIAYYFKRPDASVFTFGTLETAQTWSALQTFSAGIALSGTASNLSLGSNYINNSGAESFIEFDTGHQPEVAHVHDVPRVAQAVDRVFEVRRHGGRE